MPDTSSMDQAAGRKDRFYFWDALAGFAVGLFVCVIAAPAVVRADDQRVPPVAVSEAGALLLPSAAPAKPRRVLRLEVSAYTSRPQETDSTPFITASGTRVHDGTLATNVLPFGTKVRIPALYGDKIFVVEDRMSKRYQEHADVWVEDVATARSIGRRSLDIEVF